jgi:hypothetical protein
MQQLIQKESVKKDFGLVLNKWDGKWINSQKHLIFKTTKMLLRFLKSSELSHQEFIHMI